MTVPVALAAPTVRNVLIDAAKAAAGGLPDGVVALAEEGMRMMLLARLRPLALGLLIVVVGTAGVFAFAQQREGTAGSE